MWNHRLADNLSTRDLVLLVDLIRLFFIKYPGYTCFTVYECLSAFEDVQVFIHMYDFR